MRTISHSASAPEAMRIEVKLAASMWLVVNAARHNKEFPAKASIASSVRRNTRGRDIGRF